MSSCRSLRTPFGDYTIRLQSNSGEMAFVPGAITIDPAVTAPIANPVDDSRFFVNQHFADVTGRAADSLTLEKLTTQLLLCGSRTDCLRAARLRFPRTCWSTSCRPPLCFSTVCILRRSGVVPADRILSDRAMLLNETEDHERARTALVTAFMQRPEFKRKYPATMKPAEFVDAILATVLQTSGVDLCR